MEELSETTIRPGKIFTATDVGLAAAAGTQEGNKLSLMDIDTDSPEDLGFAKGLRNILELEDKIRHFAPP